MDIVLGVSMAPTDVRMVLVEGEDADGVTVEEDVFEVTQADGSATASAPEQVIAAILGTREGAAESGYRLASTGVTWTEPDEVAALRDALATREISHVMLVAPLLAAAALAQTVGHAIGYEYTALLFVEAHSATLAVVKTADGSIVDLHRRQVQCQPYRAEAVGELAAMVEALGRLESRPGGVFIVGCGVDIVPIKPLLDAAVSLPVSAAEEPAMALARGAALASANAPLFASSTAALAYAQDPGTGEVNPDLLPPSYLEVCASSDVSSGVLAYSAVSDEDDRIPRRRPGLLVSTGVAAVLAIGLVALVVSLAADIRPSSGRQPEPNAGVVPTQAPPTSHPPAAAAPAPPAVAPPAPPPSAAPSPPPAAPSPPPAVPAPPPQTIPAPAPVVKQSPQRVVSPAPVQQAPAPQAPAYVPPAPQEAPPPAAPPPPPPAAPPPPPPAAPPPPPAPQLPPMVMYLRLPFVTVPIPINPPPPPPGS